MTLDLIVVTAVATIALVLMFGPASLRWLAGCVIIEIAAAAVLLDVVD